jgi:hypothetical protein
MMPLRVFNFPYKFFSQSNVFDERGSFRLGSLSFEPAFTFRSTVRLSFD